MSASVVAGQVHGESSAVFARHESFHPRYGWLKKGYDLYENLSGVDAPVVLGVGKNMVSAIRYWSLAFKVLEEVRAERGLAPSLRRSALGDRLFGESGFDPYLENPATLWLLHWHLLARPNLATAWYYTFFKFNRSEFTSDELAEALMAFKAARFPQAKATEGSLKKDVACLIRMYARHTGGGRMLAEDSLDSPFVELGLVVPGPGPRQYSFNVGPKPTLPQEVIVAACLDFLASDPGANHAQSIGLGRLLDEEGAPGRAFRLSEAALGEAIEGVARKYKFVRLTETAGVLQVSLDGSACKRSEELVASFFREGAPA